MNAVEYVLLPETELDPFGGPREAAILRSSPPGLQAVFRTANWTIYRVRRPTPLLTGPGRSLVLTFDHTTIRGTVSRPGAHLLRVHFNELWSTSPGICVTPGPDGMSWLNVSTPGPFRLSAPSAPTAFARAIAGRTPCGNAHRIAAGQG